MLYDIAIRLGNVKRRRRRANIRGNTQLVLHVTLQPPRDRRSTEFTKPDRGCRFFSFSVECKCVAKKPATRDVRYTWPTCQCCRNLNLDINRWSPCRSDPEVFAVWYAAWHDRSNVGNLIRLAVPSYKSSLVEYSVISCYLNANLHKRNKKKEDHRVETNAISNAAKRYLLRGIVSLVSLIARIFARAEAWIHKLGKCWWRIINDSRQSSVMSCEWSREDL